MQFDQGHFEEAATVLRSLIGPVRAEHGCVTTGLLKDADGASQLTWVEEWHSLDDFEHHVRGTAFRSILAVIELATSEPMVEIDEVGSRRGFEFVEEIFGVLPGAPAEVKKHQQRRKN